MINLCPQAIIYLIFSLTQIFIDLYKGLYNTVGMKIIVMIMVTILLNILCERNMGIVSWIIVFIPFVLMTVIVTILLYAFGLDAATGQLNYNDCSGNTNCNDDVTTDTSGNIIIYDPNYNSSTNPVYYNSPNVIVPNPNNNPNANTNTTTTAPTASNYQPVPEGSSSPAYES